MVGLDCPPFWWQVYTAILSWALKRDLKPWKLFCFFERAVCLTCSICPQITHCDYGLPLPPFPMKKDEDYIKIVAGVRSTGEKTYPFVLSWLDEILWNPLAHGVGGPSGSKTGQTLPPNSHWHWPDCVCCSSLFKNNNDAIIMHPSGVSLRKRGEVKSRLFWNRKLLWITFYQSIIFCLYKTLLQGALGEHRCLCSVPWDFSRSMMNVFLVLPRLIQWPFPALDMGLVQTELCSK